MTCLEKNQYWQLHTNIIIIDDARFCGRSSENTKKEHNISHFQGLNNDIMSLNLLLNVRNSKIEMPVNEINICDKLRLSKGRNWSMIKGLNKNFVSWPT